MTEREALHSLIDTLPPYALTEAERVLNDLRARYDDPVLRAFMEAPEDDEPETPEERAGIEAGRAEIARGEFVTLDQLDKLRTKRR